MSGVYPVNWLVSEVIVWLVDAHPDWSKAMVELASDKSDCKETMVEFALFHPVPRSVMVEFAPLHPVRRVSIGRLHWPNWIQGEQFEHWFY